MELTLRLLDETFAVCRLPADAPLPDWSLIGQFFSVTRTHEELSLIVVEEGVPKNPPNLKVETGWKAWMVVGPLDFWLTGILASVARPLADAGIPIFALSTFDTDYVLVKQEKVEDARKALAAAGHQFVP